MDVNGKQGNCWPLCREKKCKVSQALPPTDLQTQVTALLVAAVERAAKCAAGVAAVFEPAAGLLLLKLPEALIRSQEYLRHLAAK